jgi:hypothetical protein
VYQPGTEPLDLGIIHAFKCHYRKQLIQKTVVMTDGGPLQDATQIKLDVLSAMHFIAEGCRLVIPTIIKNYFLKCGFSNDVNSNDDRVVKLSEDEDDNWRSLQHVGVQFENYATCDSVVEVCGMPSVNQVLHQHLRSCGT